jgi:branched-subunit amino acid transport protein
MTAPYRKLPGTRRGFIRKSSVWAGPDHLLLVRGTRFRDEYKRFYYRDVQAITVARAPRFHISTRAGVIAFACWVLSAVVQILVLRASGIQLFGFIYTPVVAYGGILALVGISAALPAFVGLILAIIWAYVSAAQSCRCRIYTAVSGDELPSVYRMWTARKFLAQLEPLIAQTQGTIAGEWAAAAEDRTVGPPPVGRAPTGVPRAAMHSVEPGAAGPPRRTLVTDLFLASLFADAMVKVAPLPPALNSWLPYTMPLVTIAGAVTVIVLDHRGRLRTGINRVAVASLVAFGLLYYVQSLSAGIAAGLTAAKTGKQTIVVPFPRSKVAQQAGAGFDAILVIVGLIVSLREDDAGWRRITG